MGKTEKLAVFEKLTFSPETLKLYQLYQNINFSDSDAISINNSGSLDCATVASGYVINSQLSK